MGGRQSWRFGEPERFLSFSEAEFFIGGLERFTEDWFEPVGNYSLAVLKIGNVLDKSLAAAGRKIFFVAESTGSLF
jgi:hypothetical protein